MTEKALLLAIVQDRDETAATTALRDAGFQTTRIRSRGGFLETGNTTFLIDLGRPWVAAAVRLLARTCHARETFMNAALSVPAVGMHTPVAPVQVEIGGGTVFVLPLERLIRIDEVDLRATGDQEGQDRGMKLIVAVIPEACSDHILASLVGSGYRATRISATGGFLRQGNATFWSGVEARLVNDVLGRIKELCTAAAPETRSPCLAGSIFVLKVEQFSQL